jgi:hypothetical protein
MTSIAIARRHIDTGEDDGASERWMDEDASHTVCDGVISERLHLDDGIYRMSRYRIHEDEFGFIFESEFVGSKRIMPIQAKRWLLKGPVEKLNAEILLPPAPGKEPAALLQWHDRSSWCEDEDRNVIGSFYDILFLEPDGTFVIRSNFDEPLKRVPKLTEEEWREWEPQGRPMNWDYAKICIEANTVSILDKSFLRLLTCGALSGLRRREGYA